MCIVKKYANIYLQKVYIVMSCLCDSSKLGGQTPTVINGERDVDVRRRE